MTEQCSHCQDVDTREHRIYTCAATQHIRADHFDTLRQVQEDGRLYHELPVITSDHDTEFFHTFCDHLAEPLLDETLQTRLRQLQDFGHTLRFYTDGSCENPTVFDASHAAISIVFDSTSGCEERMHFAKHWKPDLPLPCLQTILAMRLPGEQCIHRAEILALIILCETFSDVEIVTDSQAARALGCKCLQLRNPRELYNHSEPDLALRFWSAVRTGKYVFTKVKAHMDIHDCEDLCLKYDRIGNDVADRAAQQTCRFLNERLVEEAMGIAKRLTHQHNLLLAYFNYFLDLQTARAKLRKQSHQFDQHELVPDDRESVSDKLAKYCLTEIWTMPPIRFDHSRDNAWGPTWGKFFFDWLLQLRWPSEQSDVEYQHVGITWVELSISLMLYAQQWIPLRRKGLDGKERLVTFTCHDDLAGFQVRFSEFADSLSQMFTQMSSLVDVELHPTALRKLVTACYIQGFSIHSSGLSLRPMLPNQTAVLSTLKTYLADNKGPGWVVTPKLDITVDPIVAAATIKSELRGVWADRCQHSQKSAVRLRKAEIAQVQAEQVQMAQMAQQQLAEARQAFAHQQAEAPRPAEAAPAVEAEAGDT
eukprot:Skav232370  [mRNA]  locus=scaffold1077:19822:25215:+ [translate_table: standard]